MLPPPRSSSPAPRLSALQVTLVALLVFASLLNYVDRQATAAVSPTLKQEFHLTDEAWGWMNTAFSAAYTVTTSLGGLWIDRVGVGRGLLISVIIWSFAAAGHALATSFAGLCGWRMLLAVGEGPGAASPLKGVRRVLPREYWDFGTALIGAGAAGGAMVAPILVSPLAERFGWRAAFLVTAAVSLLWIPVWVAFAFGSRANLQSEESASPHPQRPRTRLNWRSHALWATALCILFTVPPTVFTNNFLALYLSRTYQVTQGEMGRWLWQPFLWLDVGQLLGGAVISFWIIRGWRPFVARRLIIVIGFLGSLVLGLAVRATDEAGAMFWLNASRFFFQAAYIAMVTYAIQAVPDDQTAYLNGLMNGAFSICNMVMNPVIGRLADRHGYSPVLVVVTVLPMVGLTCWLVLTARHERLLSHSGADGRPPSPA